MHRAGRLFAFFGLIVCFFRVHCWLFGGLKFSERAFVQFD